MKSSIKPGWMTSEFYLVVGSMIIDGLTTLINSNIYSNHPALTRDLLIVQTVLVSVYALGRSIIKAFTPNAIVMPTENASGIVA